MVIIKIFLCTSILVNSKINVLQIFFNVILSISNNDNTDVIYNTHVKEKYVDNTRMLYLPDSST